MSLLNTVSISKASIPGHELTDEEKQIEVGKWIRDFAISFTNAANNVKYGEITGAKIINIIRTRHILLIKNS